MAILRFLLTLLLSFFLHFTHVIAQPLSTNAYISVMTCSPGPLLYQSWGHAAVLVHDPRLRLDKIYNYGTFDSSIPNFYVKFVRGVVPYFLNSENYVREFLRTYKFFHQDVEEQILNLTPYQKQKLFHFLEHNLLPEHKFYTYDQFYDNCSIRIKWAIENVLQDSVRFDASSLAAPMTFREAIDPFIVEKPWIDFGIDLILGAPVDHTMKAHEYSFLPIYMHETLDHGEVLDSMGRWNPLVSAKRKVYDSDPFILKPALITPFMAGIMLLGLIILITFWEWKNQKHIKWIDISIFSVYGLIGWILLGLWLGTEHKELSWNYNILWLLPTHLLSIFYLWSSKPNQIFHYYLIFTGITNMILLLFSGIIPQTFHFANYPLILLLTIRVFWIIYHKR